MAWRLIAWVVLGLAALPAEAREAAPLRGEVIIRFRHPAMICAGVCPNYQIEILANGDVVRGNPTPQPTDRDHLYSNTVFRFHVLPTKLRQFRSRLDALRPRGDRALDATCNRSRLPDGSFDPLSTPSPDDIEVRWIEADRGNRLTACAYDEPLRAQLQSALRSLGVDPFSG